MLRTLIFAVILGVGGTIAASIWSIVMTLSALPGGVIWIWSVNKSQIITKPLAVLISWLPQVYLGLSFVVAIVGITVGARSTDPSPWAIVAWPLAFSIANAPAAMALKSAATTKQDEQSEKNSTGATISWGLTSLSCIIGFFVFIFNPSLASILWGWVPFSASLK